ncbi:hypothetical protein V6Z11_D05G237800 [Gossypium hirsutum]
MVNPNENADRLKQTQNCAKNPLQNERYIEASYYRNLCSSETGDQFIEHDLSQVQQMRGIRVKVRNGNLEQALAVMQRVMQSSGTERLIKQEQTHHIKNSEKRILARKILERKIKSQDHARKLQTILIKKVRYLRSSSVHKF